MKKSNIEQIIELGEKGLNVHEISEKLNLGIKGVYYHLNKHKVKLKDLKEGKSPQLKAWDTRKKLEALAAYNDATSKGIKASVARKFRKLYGIDIKTLNAPKVEKVKEPKVKKVRVTKVATTKKTFEEKEVALYTPLLLARIEILEKRLEALEKKK